MNIIKSIWLVSFFMVIGLFGVIVCADDFVNPSQLGLADQVNKLYEERKRCDSIAAINPEDEDICRLQYLNSFKQQFGYLLSLPDMQSNIVKLQALQESLLKNNSNLRWTKEDIGKEEVFHLNELIGALGGITDQRHIESVKKLFTAYVEKLEKSIIKVLKKPNTKTIKALLGKLAIIFKVIDDTKGQIIGTKQDVDRFEQQDVSPLIDKPLRFYDPLKKMSIEERVKEISRNLAQRSIFERAKNMHDLQQVIRMYTANSFQLKAFIEELYKQGFDLSSVFSKADAIKIYDMFVTNFDYLWNGKFSSEVIDNKRNDIIKQNKYLDQMIDKIGKSKTIKKEKRYSASLLRVYGDMLLYAFEKAKEFTK